MSKQFFWKRKRSTQKSWKLLFHDCYQVNLKSPSYSLSSDITHVFTHLVVLATCPGPWTKYRKSHDLEYNSWLIGTSDTSTYYSRIVREGSTIFFIDSTFNKITNCKRMMWFFSLHNSIVIKITQELWQLASSVLCDTENNSTCLLRVLVHGWRWRNS